MIWNWALIIIFELRQKFQYFSLKNPKKQTFVRQLLSCISEKYNGFHVISKGYCDKLWKKFRPIDIINKPVKSIDENILCYYSTDLSKAYGNSCRETAEKVSHGYASECYYCGKFSLEQIDKNVILKVVAIFLGLFIISITRT